VSFSAAAQAAAQVAGLQQTSDGFGNVCVSMQQLLLLLLSSATVDWCHRRLCNDPDAALQFVSSGQLKLPMHASHSMIR
jgi:hypothetical protein